MNHHTRIFLASLLSLALPVLALADTKDLWTQNCSRCHGPDGTGQTKIGKKLGLLDYSKADVQAKMTDDEMLKTILQGFTKDGKEQMPPYKDKLSADDAKALVAYVRSFKK